MPGSGEPEEPGTTTEESCSAPARGLRWRRVFPGEDRQLGMLRRWLAALLPDGPLRDDVTAIASELAGNAIVHTASGRGGWFVVEIAWHHHLVRVAVADCGATGVPRLMEDPDGEHGRGLLVVPDDLAVLRCVVRQADCIPGDLARVHRALPSPDQHPSPGQAGEELLLRARPGRRDAYLPPQRHPCRDACSASARVARRAAVPPGRSHAAQTAARPAGRLPGPGRSHSRLWAGSGPGGPGWRPDECDPGRAGPPSTAPPGHPPPAPARSDPSPRPRPAPTRRRTTSGLPAQPVSNLS